MNLANKITLLRVLLVLVFIVFTAEDSFYSRLSALVVFVVASITDLYDGYIARKQGQVTDLGRFMDPVADKFLVSAAFIYFVSMKELNVPPWMVVLIIGREFLITGLRLVAVSKGVVIAADRVGKFKTTSQVTTIIVILILLCINSGLSEFYQIIPDDLIQKHGWPIAGNLLAWSSFCLVFVTTVLTLVSGASYLYKNRRILSDEIAIKST